MAKIIHLEINRCNQCPYADQDEHGVSCAKAEGYPQILSANEFYKGMTTRKKFGQYIPPFCPLPDK